VTVSLYTVRFCILIKRQLKLERPADSGDELENAVSHARYEEIYMAMFYLPHEISDIIHMYNFIRASHLYSLVRLKTYAAMTMRPLLLRDVM